MLSCYWAGGGHGPWLSCALGRGLSEEERREERLGGRGGLYSFSGQQNLRRAWRSDSPRRQRPRPTIDFGPT